MAELNALKSAISRSKVVISRSLADVQHLTKGQQFSYASFGRQVRAGLRVPNDKHLDNIRVQFENALFPNYSEDIIFGSLSLNQRGLRGYGDYDMVLKDKMIAQRTSVFEENPYNFTRRHRLQMTDEIPCGYRATWEERGALGIAKLHGSLNPGMTEADFIEILQHDNGGTGDSDFIEAHIYGTLNIKAVEKVFASTPESREDKLLWRILCRDLNRAGVETETE
jgi:hypothetical protein